MAELCALPFPFATMRSEAHIQRLKAQARGALTTLHHWRLTAAFANAPPTCSMQVSQGSELTRLITGYDIDYCQYDGHIQRL